MQKNNFIFSLILFVNFFKAQVNSDNLNTINNNLKISSISFIENKGQFCDQNFKHRNDVLYGANIGNMGLHIKKSGVSYQLYKAESYKEITNKQIQQKFNTIEKQIIYRVDLNWLNVNKNISQSTDEVLPGYNNYYLENCPTGALNVKCYNGVTINNLYNGINIHYYESRGNLKYDYIVSPHSDYKQIKIEVQGANIELNKNGSLNLITPLGKINEGEPVVYQLGKRLNAKWIIKNNVLSFEIENYNENLEMIIDPVTRLWGTFYGGEGDDRGFACTTDAAGNSYLAGMATPNSGFIIATSGAHQQTNTSTNAFLVKFNNNGIRQWGTYYGGNSFTVGNSCCTDSQGNVFLAGYTPSASVNVIETNGAHQTNYGGGIHDAFLVKFNSAGVRLWGTYYGGTGQDEGNSCFADINGNVYLAGLAGSNNGNSIATSSAHQTSFGGAFIAKFNANGVRQWGTYYGGTSYGYATSCAADGGGNVYLTGCTDSYTGTVIGTNGSHQSNFGGATYDAFLVKFSNNGVRQWGTYYGGAGNDYGTNCSADASGNIFLSGITSSSIGTSIASSNAHQVNYGGGVSDAFLVKFNANGIRQWGTYYGGNSDDYGISSSVDNSWNIYLSGNTLSTNTISIATNSSYQSTYNGGIETYVAKFNNNGIRTWGTYYGGVGGDNNYSCSTDGQGNIYIAGYTYGSANIDIASSNGHQPIKGMGNNPYLVKLTDCLLLNPIATVNNSVCTGSPINFTSSISGTTTVSYNWLGPNNFVAGGQNPMITNASTVNIGIYTVSINNLGCIESATTQVSSVNPCTFIHPNNFYNENLSIYPNPASQVLNIELEFTNEIENTNHELQMINVLGQIIKQQIVNGNKISINIGDLKVGVYTLLLKTEIGVLSKKIVIER